MGDSEPKHRLYGTPMSEWINLVGELDIDAVGLWQIVLAGREGFGLEGSALDDFVRRSLITHFAYGAFPVRHIPGDPNVWTIQTSYGETPEVMADASGSKWAVLILAWAIYGWPRQTSPIIPSKAGRLNLLDSCEAATPCNDQIKSILRFVSRLFVRSNANYSVV